MGNNSGYDIYGPCAMDGESSISLYFRGLITYLDLTPEDQAEVDKNCD